MYIEIYSFDTSVKLEWKENLRQYWRKKRRRRKHKEAITEGADLRSTLSFVLQKD